MKENRSLQPRTPFRQKITLVLFGLSLFFVLLEAGLRLGGFILLSLQEYRNTLSIRQKGAYRILCLGESTTRGQWPPHLQEILDQRNRGIKFSVIDKGIVGSNTPAILSQVESYLDRYHPDMVVAMMGINDQGKHIPYERPTLSKNMLFVRSFRIYKLARLLWLHMATKAREIGLYKLPRDKPLAQERQPSPLNMRLEGTDAQQEDNIKNEGLLKKALELNPKNDEVYVELGWVYLNQGELRQAEEYFKKSLELNPRNDWAYVRLGCLYRNQGELRQAEEYFKKSVELNPGNDWAYVELGCLYRNQGEPRQAEEYFKKSVELNPRDERAYFGLGMVYQDQGELRQAEGYFKKALELNPGGEVASKLYGALGTVYRERGQFTLAEEYSSKANQIRLSEYNSTTTSNYHKLKEILDKRKIKLVCAQYPMLNIEPLKKIFQGNINDVLFVDNERAFKEAVKEGSYKMYFMDMFGGDFGHCTKEGNRLLAENIANAVLKEVFGK